MHFLMEHGMTPKTNYSKSCTLCSLLDICLPGLSGRIKEREIEEYLEDSYKEE